MVTNLTSIMRTWVRSLASIVGLKIRGCPERWCRWRCPNILGVALRRQERKKEREREREGGREGERKRRKERNRKEKKRTLP